MPKKKIMLCSKIALISEKSKKVSPLSPTQSLCLWSRRVQHVLERRGGSIGLATLYAHRKICTFRQFACTKSLLTQEKIQLP